MIHQLTVIELVQETVLLGPVIYLGHYAASTGLHDSGPVLQSALLIPGGLGVVFWDSEEYDHFFSWPEPDLSQVFLKFVPFENCRSAIKALLFPQAESLLNRLLKQFYYPE